MAGLYIHVPFCRRKCHYCNFFSLATRKFRAEFLDALALDFRINKDYLSGQPVETVYVGGGTPSLFNPHDFDSFLSPLPGELIKEVTIEVNPEDVNPGYIHELRQTLFNRVSLGVQSFFEDDLRFLNREHSGEQAINAVRLLQDAGFDNISIDLIYGIPGSDSRKWKKNLETVFELGVPHLSAYALTVESGTPLDWRIRHRRSEPVNDEIQADQFRLLMKMATDHGFEHYEISNFSKPGQYAIHNTNYWNGTPYLGIGPSAHSYNGHSRRWNISNLTRYISHIHRGEPFFEEEFLTTWQCYNEYVMTSLRTKWGCRAEILRESFGDSFAEYFARHSTRFQQYGWLTESDGVYRLSGEGKLFADYVAAELFVVSGDNQD